MLSLPVQWLVTPIGAICLELQPGSQLWLPKFGCDLVTRPQNCWWHYDSMVKSLMTSWPLKFNYQLKAVALVQWKQQRRCHQVCKQKETLSSHLAGRPPWRQASQGLEGSFLPCSCSFTHQWPLHNIANPFRQCRLSQQVYSYFWMWHNQIKPVVTKL